VNALYDRLRKEYWQAGTPVPSFAEIELTLNPDVKSAALFLLNVLMGR
jgi:hypothetical protein